MACTHHNAREDPVWVEARRRHVQVELPNGDGHALNAQVTQAEDAGPARDEGSLARRRARLV